MVRLMPMQEFWEGGYLQEVNRQFLHPLGLALAIAVGPEGNVTRQVSVWDARDDPEGFAFEAGMMLRAKGLKVQAEIAKRRKSRLAALGYFIQPLPEEDETCPE
jgi:hypothetical protein